MARVKSGKVTHARHKKVLDKAKGYYGNRSRNFRT
ncbi:bL20 family ribosomal protein, partial [Klebsiella pneumoniae]|nr:bL20 family ribosomal protein [Klebsiella pneumoniae]